jgi:NAD(P)-dependent dehydrogenase (short-subunit alcohol dehydrogenase family)
MSRLSEKVAIVTGASKGIGGGIATALGAAGARVAVNYFSVTLLRKWLIYFKKDSQEAGWYFQKQL